jgi:hypothetical protein
VLSDLNLLFNHSTHYSQLKTFMIMKSQNYLILSLFCFFSLNVFGGTIEAPPFIENQLMFAQNISQESMPENTLRSCTTTNCAVSNYLTLVLNFDANPEHTSWDIRDANYNILVANSGYTTPNTTSTSNFWLASGDFLLVVYDVNGDGMAPGGSYELKDSQGNILVSGSSFTASDVNEFCVVSSNGGGLDLTPPTAPLNLTATNPTQTSIDIAFTAGTDNLSILGYVVFMNDVYIGDIYAAGPLSGTVPNLNPNTSYTFKIATVDIAGNFSPFSNLATETTLANITSTVFHEGYFETGWDGWIDGGSDCRRYSGSRSAEGNYSIRLRDNSSSSIMTLNNQDVSQYDDVTVDFEYYISSFEGSEDFWLRYYDGSTWQTVATFEKGVDFNGNGFYSGSVALSSLNHNFSSNAGFRFQCDASANNDKVFIDKIIMTGYAPGGSNLIAESSTYARNKALRFEIVDGKESIYERKVDAIEVAVVDMDVDVNPDISNFNFKEKSSDIQLYPNPANSYFNLSIEDQDQIESIYVLALNGQLIKQINPMQSRYDIFELKSGIYLVAVITKDRSTYYLKLVKT